YVRAVVAGSRGSGGDGGGGSDKGNGVAATAVAASARGLRDPGDDAITLSSSGLSVTSGEDFDGEEACDIDDECEGGMYANFDAQYHHDDGDHDDQAGGGGSAAASKDPAASAGMAAATAGTAPAASMTPEERATGKSKCPPNSQTVTSKGTSADGADSTRLGAGTVATAGVAAVAALVWPAGEGSALGSNSTGAASPTPLTGRARGAKGKFKKKGGKRTARKSSPLPAAGTPACPDGSSPVTGGGGSVTGQKTVLPPRVKPKARVAARKPLVPPQPPSGPRKWPARPANRALVYAAAAQASRRSRGFTGWSFPA
ncbi:unnamed protein product, partial [Laminaria digitata]